MAGTYELWLTDSSGVRISQLSTALGFQASRLANKVGWLNLRLPQSFDISIIQPDFMVQVWRAPEGGRLGLWRPYFIRKFNFDFQGSQENITISGPDCNDLLRRRIVAAYSGSAQATKTDFADDMMKEIVTEAIADGVAPTPTAGTRVWANLSVQAQLGLGPTLSKSFPFDKLMNNSGQGTLPAIAQAARIAGNEVFFDIVPSVVTGSSITFQFQTFINQPGQDVSSQVVFDQQRGNMKNPKLEYDYTEEENYIYAGGQGEGASRNVVQVYDAARYGVSIWGRSEGFADARNETTTNGITAAGNAQLDAGRVKINFSADPVDTIGTRFGRDWDYGYKVTARYRNIQFVSIIRSVILNVNQDGGETIQARLEFES
jgi:hypothetical protein